MRPLQHRAFLEKTVTLAQLHHVLVEANINPNTGLSTDYLNHFNEMVMMIELYPTSPDVREEILAWAPLKYREHFETSGFRAKSLALIGHELAVDTLKRQLDIIVAEIDTVLLEAQDAVGSEAAPGESVRTLEEAAESAEMLIARASALINGLSAPNQAEAEDAQAAVDALFGA